MEFDIPSQYKVIKKLGSGTFGAVYKVVKKSNNKIIALKVIKILNLENDIDLLEKEINSLKLLKPCNPFVICFYGSFSNVKSSLFYIEMEYVDGVEMLSFVNSYFYLRKDKVEIKITDADGRSNWQKRITIESFSEKFGYEDYSKVFKENGINYVKDIRKFKNLSKILPTEIASTILRDSKLFISKDYYYYMLLLITKDLARGLKFIHDKNIVHNDIKLSNIMIDKNNTPRIIDFGVSCIMKQKEHCASMGVTKAYMAPEYSSHFRYPESDMWALGVTLYKAAIRKSPYKISSSSQIKNIEVPKLNTSNETLNKIVNGLLDKNKDTRLTAEQIINMLEDVENLKPK